MKDRVENAHIGISHRPSRTSRRLERIERKGHMGDWRSSRAFETLMMRMLGLMAFSTTSGMGLLLLVKRNGDFGAHEPSLAFPSTPAVVYLMTSHAVCAQSHWMWNGRAILAKDKCAWNSFGRVALTSPLKAGRAADKEGGAHLELPQVKCTQSSFYNCGRTTRTLKICHRVQHNENVPTKRALLFLVGYEDHLRKKVASPGPRREPECDGTCTD